jgi:hypothetical protein
VGRNFSHPKKEDPQKNSRHSRKIEVDYTHLRNSPLKTRGRKKKEKKLKSVKKTPISMYASESG